MIRIALIAFLGLFLFTNEASAGCYERCGDIFSACLVNGASRGYCWRLWGRCRGHLRLSMLPKERPQVESGCFCFRK